MSFDLFDHFRLRRIEKSVEHIRKSAATPNPFAAKQTDIPELQAEVSRLRLLVAVLYRLLLNKEVASEADINALLSELDLADGKRDGSFTGDPVTGAAIVETEPPEDENPFPKIRT